MFLSKPGYYADFVVYPILLLLLGATVLQDASLRTHLIWVLACVTGLFAFTMIEYGMHRVLLHHVAPLRAMHARHHAHPAALIGTPTWVTVTLVMGGVCLPLWLEAGWNIASGLTFGLILGYLGYVLLHHAIHHWPTRKTSYLHWAKRWHAEHHHARQACNFGVTSALWDHVFGTAGKRRRPVGR